MTSAIGMGALSSAGTKQPTRSDFIPVLSLHICGNAGGHDWFPCSKNLSRSPSRTWDAMYSLEKREQSFFRDDSCSCTFEFSQTGA